MITTKIKRVLYSKVKRIVSKVKSGDNQSSFTNNSQIDSLANRQETAISFPCDYLSYSGANPNEETPWGYNVGPIWMEDEAMSALLLVAGTSCSMNGLRSGELSIKYKIHPWMTNVSPGANMFLSVSNHIGEIIFEDQLEVLPESDWKEYKIQNQIVEKGYRLSVACKNITSSDCGNWLIVADANATDRGTVRNIKQENNGFWISTHYFSDSWCVNFWDSSLTDMSEDFQKIKSDGFNSIILVVPWREFQPILEEDHCEYNYSALNKLRRIIEEAGKHGLGVILRIGYLYDVYKGLDTDNLFDRFYRISNDDGVLIHWLSFCKTIYSAVSEYANYYGAFICWEDFWIAVERAKDENGCSESSKWFARLIGYSHYMVKRYKKPELRKLFGKEINDENDIFIPETSKAAFATFYDFYDEFLNRLLLESQKVYPHLSMEVRLDADKYGRLKRYSHNTTFKAGKAAYTAAMFSVSMGMKNKGESVSARRALKLTGDFLYKIEQKIMPKKLYLDQFLFYDNTQGMEHNAQLKREEIMNYLRGSKEWLLRFTRGYGIWAYRDCRMDAVVNGEFAKGLESWHIEKGDVEIIDEDDKRGILMRKHSRISQNTMGRVTTSGDVMYLDFYGESLKDDGAIICLGLDNKIQETKVASQGYYHCSYPKMTFGTLSIEAKEDVIINKVKLYNCLQSSLMYHWDGTEGDAVSGIRILNSACET